MICIISIADLPRVRLWGSMHIGVPLFFFNLNIGLIPLIFLDCSNSTQQYSRSSFLRAQGEALCLECARAPRIICEKLEICGGCLLSTHNSMLCFSPDSNNNRTRELQGYNLEVL